MAYSAKASLKYYLTSSSYINEKKVPGSSPGYFFLWKEIQIQFIYWFAERLVAHVEIIYFLIVLRFSGFHEGYLLTKYF
ncbi:MAG: hypothetical protein ACTHK0_18880 [Ginsengibacter sp.]